MRRRNYGQGSVFRLLFPIYRKSQKNGTASVSAIMSVAADMPLSLPELHVRIGDHLIKPQIRRLTKGGRSRGLACLISFQVGLEDTKDLAIHSKVMVAAVTPEGTRDLGQMRYNALIPRYIAAHGPYLKNPGQGTVVFFRQAVNGSLFLTVRHQNVTDSKAAGLKLLLAFVLARLLPFRRPVLVYEKNASKYEESGKAVFEGLIDRGYGHVWFVIDKRAAERLDVDRAYSSKFVYRHSFRHYLYFFRSRTYLGSEAVAHALELRSQNPLAQWQMKNRRNTEVFLQHGVMYMVSLDSPERTSFRRRAYRGKVRVVVSSEREAEHFIDLAGFKPEELIVSGLAKFDSSFQNPGADKILVMPTWRIWEFNAMRDDPESTGYVAMIKEIESAIPAGLRDKVATEYHPLFKAGTYGTGQGSQPSTHQPASLDVLLRDVKLLITDYSSIAFDAFYRGANVIFYWKDLDGCMGHYGQPTHLMLDRDSAFGDVCMTAGELGDIIQAVYDGSQRGEHVHRFYQIVTHHDNQNTSRIIDALEAEGIVAL